MMAKGFAWGGVGELGIEGTSRWRYRPATSWKRRKGRGPGDPRDDDAASSSAWQGASIKCEENRASV
jgi:hypothetical protein